MELNNKNNAVVQLYMIKFIFIMCIILIMIDLQGQNYKTEIRYYNGNISRVNVLDTSIDFKARITLHEVFNSDKYFGPEYCLYDSSKYKGKVVNSSYSSRVNCEPECFVYKLSSKDSSCLRCYTVYWDTLKERLTCLVMLKEGCQTMTRMYRMYEITEKDYLEIPQKALLYVGPLNYYLNASCAYAWIYVE
jgi:hypothetical protein